jgi:hypothetical protein
MPCINDTRRQAHKKLYDCNCTCPAYNECKELWGRIVDYDYEDAEYPEEARS